MSHCDGCPGCGHCGGHAHSQPLSAAERALLGDLAELAFLPAARFLLKSTKSSHAEAVAMSPVYIKDKSDDLAIVRERGQALLSLAHRGLITIDEDLPLENLEESLFTGSSAYREFCAVVSEGALQPDFVFDTPGISFGSVALTLSGQDALEE